MKQTKAMASLALCGLVFGTGAVVGQQTAPQNAADTARGIVIDAEVKVEDSTPRTQGPAVKELAEVYDHAGSDKAYSDAIQRYSLDTFATGQSIMGERGSKLCNAATYKLLLLQTQQNERIIALLEAQAKQKAK